MSKDYNDDWLNYELNHEEFKAALGLRAKDEDGQTLGERIPDDHDERPNILQINDSSLIGRGLESPKRDTPQVFFTTPTRSMTRHLRPLFISTRINGLHFKKVLIDGGAAVNILPFKRLEKLGKSKKDLIPTELTISNFAGTIAATHGILIAEFEVSSKNLMVSYLVVDNTSSYHALMCRDWIHQSMSIPSSLQHELLLWDEEIEDYEMIKADPHYFLPSANNVDTRFYNEDIASLTVPELIKNGHSLIVMAQKFLQQGLTFSSEEWERPQISFNQYHD
ncbi:hypothetical protein L3X38_012202 [Prunus dulcis]|uniref:Uncharacterized protein n=1 Tax=Prunus dulcis TaxID=3755 RepID=A0AAD4WJ07_PRUDU|nr:hypothetical protein L3X38_012202 [Prunus dulcis]